ERLGVAQVLAVDRVGIVIGYADGDGIVARALRLGRSPTELARSGVNAGASRCARIEAEGLGIGGNVRVGSRGGEGQRGLLIHRFVRNRIQSRRQVHFVDRDGEGFAVVQVWRTVVRQPNG